MFSKLSELFHVFAGFGNNRTPRQLIIQLTDRCNALCPQCGMRRTERFTRSKLDLDEVKRILDAAAQMEVKIVSFTGGEPLLYLDELAEMIRYAGSTGIQYIRTGTNGFMFTGSQNNGFPSRIKRIAETLAATPLRNLWISIDSAIPSVHEKMRGFPGVITGIKRALPIFHEYGIYPSANLGINRNIAHETIADLGDDRCSGVRERYTRFYLAFKNAFIEYYQFVVDLGFTMVSGCYPMSVNGEDDIDELKPVYHASSLDHIVRFDSQEKSLLFKALLDVVPLFRSRIRIISPRSSLYALFKQHSNSHFVPYPCRGGIDYFFIDSRDGNTYPCGYRGHENLGKLWDLDLKAIDDNITCFLCDWECFRDPSELLGPLVNGFSSPLDLLKKIRRDSYAYKLWIDDLKYYRTCDLFDGRKPPNLTRMRHF